VVIVLVTVGVVEMDGVGVFVIAGTVFVEGFVDVVIIDSGDDLFTFGVGNITEFVVLADGISVGELVENSCCSCC